MSLLVVRADASRAIGLGHLMRGLALAERWVALGGRVTVAASCDAEAPRARAAAFGAAWREVPFGEDGVDAAADLVRDAREDAFAPWCAVDGYHFTAAARARLRAAFGRLLALDDGCDPAPGGADLVLNQNAGAEASSYGGRDPAALLLGPRYALLRPEFGPDPAPRPLPPRAETILVTFGGADPENATQRVLEALAPLAAGVREVRVLVGPAFRHREGLLAFARESPLPLRMLEGVPDVAAELARADLVVAAAGTTALEVCRVGVPAVYVCIAGNQRAGAEALARAGAAVNLGALAALAPGRIAAAVATLADSPALRQRMREAGRALVDGRGAGRVIRRMRELQLSCRSAGAEDRERVWRWANDEMARRMSFTSAPIPWDDHAAWFAGSLASRTRHLYILETDRRVPIGCARFDDAEQGATTTISVALDTAVRGMGLGAAAITRACRHYARTVAERDVVALIKRGNAPSLKAFAAAGFEPGPAGCPEAPDAVRLTRRAEPAESAA